MAEHEALPEPQPAESHAMPRRSAGILLFRRSRAGLQVLLVHPGGPFWRKKDSWAWSIPKGEIGDDEPPEAAARREFQEETGWPLHGPLLPLGEVRQAGGKMVIAFACEGDALPDSLKSGTFEMEWPPRSGRRQAFPEVDRAGWFTLDEARTKLLPGQVPLLERLSVIVKGRNGAARED